MKNEALTLAKKLISIPSVAHDTDQLIAVLKVAETYLKGYHPQSFSSNTIPSLLYSNNEKETKKFKIILNAHLDVVPAKKEQFEPYEKGGKLYGRGAYDMKAASAVMISLFKEIAQEVPYALGLQLVTDEETGGLQGTNYQIDKGIRAEFAICGEGTGFRIINETKSIMNIKLTSHGKKAHSAYPWLGKNAVWHMYEALDNIIKHYPIPQEETPLTTVNIAKIENDNNAHNVVPDNCTAYLNIRYVSNENETLIPKLKSLLPSDVTLEIIRKDISGATDPKGFYISHFKKEAEKVLRTKLPITRAHGASDTRFFREVGCDAIEFGPVGYGHHGDEEWLYINSMEQYYQILKTFLLSLK